MWLIRGGPKTYQSMFGYRDGGIAMVWMQQTLVDMRTQERTVTQTTCLCWKRILWQSTPGIGTAADNERETGAGAGRLGWGRNQFTTIPQELLRALGCVAVGEEARAEQGTTATPPLGLRERWHGRGTEVWGGQLVERAGYTEIYWPSSAVARLFTGCLLLRASELPLSSER